MLGLRLAPPRSLAGAAASVTYAASLAATLLGALGALPGPSPAAPLPLRLAGIAALLAGLLLAGRAGRAGLGPPARGTARPGPLAYAGLALVLLGQLLRAPSAAGAAALAAAALAHGWAAWSARRAPAGV